MRTFNVKNLVCLGSTLGDRRLGRAQACTKNSQPSHEHTTRNGARQGPIPPPLPLPSALHRALRRMAGLVFLFVFWALAGAFQFPKARRGRFFYRVKQQQQQQQQQQKGWWFSPCSACAIRCAIPNRLQKTNFTKLNNKAHKNAKSKKNFTVLRQSGRDVVVQRQPMDRQAADPVV